MVESSKKEPTIPKPDAAGLGADGVKRDVQYAIFRTDKAADPGYSCELVSNRLEPQYYEALDKRPNYKGYDGIDTLMQLFQLNVKLMPNDHFLGTRQKKDSVDSDGNPEFGDYTWLTYTQVDENSKNLARGLHKNNFCPQVADEFEGKNFSFCGIWSKNRQEWLTTLLGCMHYNYTVVGFYDAMGVKSVDFILNQTQMTTIIASGEYIKKLVQMKEDGYATHITSLITLDTLTDSKLFDIAKEFGVTIYTYDDILKEGAAAKSDVPEFETPSQDDFYMFSYTSGTTGDSKGVMLTHKNIMSQAYCAIERINLQPGDAQISYLPYPHSYEQILTANALMMKCRIGYYQGDPLKIKFDCQLLKPALFPSVPRLYNRIYSVLKTTVDTTTCCKGWLMRKAIAAKLYNLERTGEVRTSGCLYSRVTNKMAAVLGGKVKLMSTGSAPIDKNVLDFLKVCFSCPIIEGYGLTESATGGGTTDIRDKITGHIGGPSEALKIRLKDLPEMEYLSSDKPYPRGEICMQGPCIFKGYYMKPEITEKAFDDGWFLTGDVGMIYENGSIKIIDRSKNIFKLAQGEYIAPEKIENIFLMSPYIAQSMVYGHSLQSCCVAIIIPQEENAKAWMKKHGMENLNAVYANEDYKKEIMDDMARLAKENNLSGLEKPKKIFVTGDAFTIENDMLTPTFKLKRNVAQKVYDIEINKMYNVIKEAEAQRQL